MATDDAMEIAPILVPGVDVSRLALDSKDGFLLSRIDGVTPASLIADLVGMPAPAVDAALTRLERLGVVRWTGAGLGHGDLTSEERTRIMEAERNLDSRNHWQVLGLSGEVTAASVKRAYFDLSLVFHPD